MTDQEDAIRADCTATLKRALVSTSMKHHVSVAMVGQMALIDLVKWLEQVSPQGTRDLLTTLATALDDRERIGHAHPATVERLAAASKRIEKDLNLHSQPAGGTA